MTLSILCYVPPTAERLGPTTPKFSNPYPRITLGFQTRLAPLQLPKSANHNYEGVYCVFFVTISYFLAVISIEQNHAVHLLNEMSAYLLSSICQRIWVNNCLCLLDPIDKQTLLQDKWAQLFILSASCWPTDIVSLATLQETLMVREDMPTTTWASMNTRKSHVRELVCLRIKSELDDCNCNLLPLNLKGFGQNLKELRAYYGLNSFIFCVVNSNRTPFP